MHRARMHEEAVAGSESPRCEQEQQELGAVRAVALVGPGGPSARVVVALDVAESGIEGLASSGDRFVGTVCEPLEDPSKTRLGSHVQRPGPFGKLPQCGGDADPGAEAAKGPELGDRVQQLGLCVGVAIAALGIVEREPSCVLRAKPRVASLSTGWTWIDRGRVGAITLSR